MSKRPKDPDAFERKVKPIYDALDSRNWKGALKLCQQALQKYPDSELIKVLKAIGLERSGKREEANEVVDEVLAATPTDEQTLRLATMVLRSCYRFSDITRMYEAAAAAVAPRGGELALVLQHEVFGSHVREFNFVKQQQVALKLSKAAGAVSAVGLQPAVSVERYGWWVVLSILLQARAALRARASGVAAPAGQVPAVALEPEKLLALAEGMVARQAAKDKRLEGYEALMVYVDVLLAQGKAAEALGLVSGPLGAAAIRLPAERLQLRAVLSALSGDLAAAAELLREGLALNPDDWGALLLLLDCLLPGTAESATHGSGSSDAASSGPTFTPQHPLVLISGGVAEQLPPRGVPLPPGGGSSPEDFAQAESILQELVARGSHVSSSSSSSENGGGGNGEGSGGGKAMTMRGPDLALVDLALRRHRAAPTADTETAVVDTVLSYYRKYGSLVSCAVDLRTYVAQLGPDAAARLAEAVQAEADAAAAAAVSGDGAAADGPRAALASLRRRVCAAQIRDDLGLPQFRACEEGVAASKELLELYGTAEPLQVGLDERERGAADELPVLAAAALVTAAARAATDAAAMPYLLAAYGALSDAVRSRPFGAGMRISLAALAALLAAPAAAAAHLYKLDIKHIQLDSLAAHLLLPPLLTWPHGGAGAAAAPAEAAAPISLDPTGSQQQQLLHKALRDTQALFDDHIRDAGESLFTAYGHGSYTKVLEFTAFRERLAAAHTYAVVRAEAAVADCLRGSTAAASTSGAGASSGPAAAAAEGLPTAEAMRSAAVAAAGRLHPDQVPSAGSLRFNWDLSTRPTWLPPCAAGPSASVGEWWRSRAAGRVCGQGYGRCWWSAPGSAESAAAAAAAEWRTCQAAAAAHRWLLPHCIAGALGATAPGVLSLRDAVERLRNLPATPEESGTTTEVDSGAACTTAGWDELRRLDVKLYGTALAVQDCLGSSAAAGAAAAPPPSLEDATADAACGALQDLAAATRRLADGAAAGVAAAATEAAAWGGVLPGGQLAVLSHLLREPMPVVAACMQSWQAALKALRKRRAKAGGALEPAAQRLSDGLTAAAAELAAAASAAAEALTAATAAAPAEAAAQVVRYLKEQGHAGCALSEAATSSLEGLIREQRHTVGLLARQAAAVAAAFI